MPEVADNLTPLEKQRLIAFRQKLKAMGVWEAETQNPVVHLLSDILEAVEEAPVDEHGIPLRKICIHCASPSRDTECSKCFLARKCNCGFNPTFNLVHTIDCPAAP